MKIEVTDTSVSVFKPRTLIDPETRKKVVVDKHGEAVSFLNHLPEEAEGDPARADPAAVEAAKATARDEIKALLEEVTGPEFADIVARVKVAEDERDIHRAKAEQLRNEAQELRAALARNKEA